MNTDLISSLARLHRDELLLQAAHRRLLVRDQPKAGVRKALGRAIRALGYYAMTLGDALTETH